jgi:hypothetical protein
MPPKRAPTVYELRITLMDIDPPIWRRIQVANSIKLCCLHTAFQIAMGWTDSHLHQFEKEGKSWGVPEWDEFDEFDLIDESKTQLGNVLRSEGESMTYQYDFGDDWEHEVVMEKIQRVEGRLAHPICLTGDSSPLPPSFGMVIRS